MSAYISTEGGIKSSGAMLGLFCTFCGSAVCRASAGFAEEDGAAVGFPDVVDQQRRRGRKVAVFPVSENDWLDMGQLPELENMRKKLYGE